MGAKIQQYVYVGYGASESMIFCQGGNLSEDTKTFCFESKFCSKNPPMTVVVANLVERLLLIPEVRS